MRAIPLSVILTIATLASAKPILAAENERVVDVSNGIKVISKVSDLDSAAHKITPCRQRNLYPEDSRSEWACVIDGVPAFGVVSAEIPNKIDSIEFILNKSKIKLDVSGMYYGPGSFYLIKNSPWYTLRGCFGDGIATYTAEWLILKGHSVRTLLRGYEESSREREWCKNAK